MATNSEFTTIPQHSKRWVYNRKTRDYALYLDDQPVGTALTPDAAEAELDRLIYEQLRHGQVATPPPAEPDSAAAEIPNVPAEDACAASWAVVPSPSAEVVAEALDELAAIPSPDAHFFFHARARLRAGVRVVADLETYWIDGHGVRHDPAHVGWPWVCACARPHCWHAALAEALALAAEHPRVLDLAA